MNLHLNSIVVIAALFCMAPLHAEAQKGWKTHTVEGEFSFKYPPNWDLKERENRFTNVVVSLNYDKGDSYAHIKFESIIDAIDKKYINDDDKILSRINNLTKIGYQGSNIFESGVDKYNINNQTAPYTIVTYSKENTFGFKHDYVAMIIAMKINHEFVVAQYISFEDDFDRFLGDAEKIFESVTPVNSTTS